eukprot:2457069-Amphidinium_carterae.3
MGHPFLLGPNPSKRRSNCKHAILCMTLSLDAYTRDVVKSQSLLDTIRLVVDYPRASSEEIVAE